jgi:hypothetical protein
MLISNTVKHPKLPSIIQDFIQWKRSRFSSAKNGLMMWTLVFELLLKFGMREGE